MSMWGDALGAAFGGVGLGLPLAHFWGDLTSKPNSTVSPLDNSNPLTAKRIKVPGQLASTFNNVGAPASTAIANNYATQGTQQGTDAQARGLSAPGSYTTSRMATTQGLDQGNLKASLGGQMADTAYKDALSDRGYQQQSALAQDIGKINKPDLLSQIFQGIGGAGQLAGMYSGMQGAGGGSGGSSVPSGAGSLPPSLSLYSGGNPYGGFDPFAAYQSYPNMMRTG